MASVGHMQSTTHQLGRNLQGQHRGKEPGGYSRKCPWRKWHPVWKGLRGGHGVDVFREAQHEPEHEVAEHGHVGVSCPRTSLGGQDEALAFALQACGKWQYQGGAL